MTRASIAIGVSNERRAMREEPTEEGPLVAKYFPTSLLVLRAYYLQANPAS